MKQSGLLTSTQTHAFAHVCKSRYAGAHTACPYRVLLQARWSGDRLPLGRVRFFCNRRDRPWGPTSLLYNGYRDCFPEVELVRNLTAHGDAREGKLANGVGSQYSHATSERDISSVTKADVHTSAASSRLNWRPHRFECTRPFRGKTKSGFCACAITFRTSYKAAGACCWQPTPSSAEVKERILTHWALGLF